MRYFLSHSCRPVALRLARGRTLCAFDFDGTLAPIVEHPDRARMSASTRRLLIRLARYYPCTIISGRARRDLLRKLSGVSVTRAIGNHGVETEGVPPGLRRQVGQWASALGPALADSPGVWVEDKGLSLAVHYRQAPDKSEARQLISSATAGLKHARVFGGKLVVNLVSDRSPDKGAALAAERDRLGCKWALYVGDDENDEDAFALKGNVVPIRIGRKRTSHARYYLREQAEIDRLLELMLELRTSRDV